MEQGHGIVESTTLWLHVVVRVVGFLNFAIICVINLFFAIIWYQSNKDSNQGSRHDEANMPNGDALG